MTVKRGLSLISSDYVHLNRNLLPVKFPGMKTTRQLDKSGQNFIIVSELSGAPVLDPVGIAVNRYFDMRRRLDWRTKFIELTLAKPAEVAAGSDKLELIGADIAGQHVALRVSGNVNINGRLQSQNSSQVNSTYSTGTSTSFVVDQKQQLNIEGKIGDRISILVDQDSERDFDFENNLKIIYTGKEDDIVQKVEAGNISLSLPGTQYVTFSGTNSGLYGFKSLMQFGGIDVTAIASVEKGKKEKLSIDGGAQTSKIAIKDYDYRKNIYFYLDTHFRENMYSESGYQKDQVFHQDSRGTVQDLKVYKSQTIETAGCIRGTAYVDPRDTTLYPDKKAIRLFKLLELEKDYIIYESMGYLKMTTQLTDGEVLAVAYRITDPNKNTVAGEEYGDYARTDTTAGNYILKLIKPETMLPSHPCWDLEFKNVYYLGTTGIEKEGFNLEILNTQGSSKLNYDAASGKDFLQLFGLDIMNDNGEKIPNGIIDQDNVYLLNLYTGELWFPFLRPFQYDSLDASGERNPNLSEVLNCSAMYDSNRTNTSEINGDTKFEIVVSYENRSSIISLGAMVIENSESVTLNNNTLARNVDYTIDYFTGTLTLLNPDATNPDANLEVKYEKNQFFQLDKKTILGARAQYDFGDNCFIGGTALYYSQSVTDEKVEVGYEPYRNFVWDINGKYTAKLNFLTRAINWLPLISTNTESSIDFEGEIAQVIPTVNTLSNDETGDPNGVGFIDDFESSERVTAPPIMRRYWTKSAVPIGKTENERGHTIWYNPYGSVATTSIWPDKEVSTTAQNTTTEVLVFRVNPAWSIAVTDGVSVTQSAWGGVTYSFPQSYYDQSNSKYIDVWIKGNTGTLHIDMGNISEDQNNDGILNTEDIPEGLSTGNGLLEQDKEDTGLDGLWDKDETVITAKYGALGYGDARLKEYGRDPYDPHSDNWKYSEGSRDYSKVNGTENNADDASNGRYPDTEDLDNDYGLDVTNDYYTVSFDLADEYCSYIAGATAISGKPTGWKLYRVPLTAFNKSATGSDVKWENIIACRLWLDGLSQKDSLYIAQIEIVGNEWEELGVAKDDTASYVEKEATFTMAVINTEDNPDIYDPPDGVLGEYDQVTQTRAKEQSLVLSLPEDGEGLYPGELCASKKVLIEEASYITYKEMKLFVKGYELKADGYQFTDGEETPLQFFVRFGKISDNSPTTSSYYEYRQPVYPGWDSKNEMKLDLDFMTTLKLYNSSDEYIGDGEFSIDTSAFGVTIRHYRELNTDGYYTGKEIIIYGSPSLSSIKRLDVGLRNRADNSNCLNAFKTGTIKGQVWLDELRLSEVRSDKGMAYRAKSSLRMADLASFDVSITHKDADFHTVEQRSSLETDNLQTTETINATGRISLDKLTPASWGISIPVSGSYTQSKGTRKYVYGSDILMEDNPADSLLDISRSYGVNTSFKKRVSDYWLSKYTIDQMQVGLNATWSEGSTVTVRESKSESYKANISYQFPFPKEKYFQPLKWIAKIPVLGDKISETRLYYFPNNLSVAADAGKSTSYKIQRTGTTVTSSNKFDLNRNLALGYKILDNLSANYSLNLDNNLIDLWQRQWETLQSFNPGKLETYRESYSASFTPKIFKWFSPSFNYTSNFNWSDPLTGNEGYVDAVSNQRRISTTFSLDPSAIFTSFFKSAAQEPAKPSTPTGGRRSGQTRGTGNQPPGPDKPADLVQPSGQTPPPEQETAVSRRSSGKRQLPDDKQPVAPTDGQTIKTPMREPEGVKKSAEWSKTVAKYLKKIQTINVSFSTNNSLNNRYLIGMPDLMYRLGLSDDPGLPLDTTHMIATNLKSTTQSLDGSIRSGLSLFSNVNIPLTYSQNMSTSQSQSTISRTLTRDYLPLGTKGKDGFPFPGWSLTWSQLEKYSLFTKIFKKLSLDHGFSGKEMITSQNGKEISSSYKMYFQPLIGLSMQFVNDISASARVTGGQTINNTSSGKGGTTKIDDAAISATINWQKKGGLTIPLPFLKDKRLENALTFSANIDYSTSQTRARNDNAKKFGITAKSRAWKTTPKINYTFSKKVTGGVFFEYGESYNKNTGQRITRNYGFDVNIAIRG